MITFHMMAQPDDESCGLACLYSIYTHYNIDISYDHVVDTVERSLSGGTLAPLLGKHALGMGFNVTLYTNNLILFDPSWFNHEKASNDFLSNKLKQQLACKKERFLGATHIFLDYLQLGGKVAFKLINVDLLKHYFLRNIPIVAALNSTYLYDTCRDFFDKEGNVRGDDIAGSPCGHFVILHGYDKEKNLVSVADPFAKNTLSETLYYSISFDRLINAIMLGVSTYDGNLLIIEPKTSLGGKTSLNT